MLNGALRNFEPLADRIESLFEHLVLPLLLSEAKARQAMRTLSLALLLLGWLACEAGELSTVMTSTDHHSIASGSFDKEDLAVVLVVGEGASFCTGTLVAPRVVLTAAHCLGVGLPTVVFGSSYESGTQSETIDATSHPDANLESGDKDAALLLLAKRGPANVVPAVINEVELTQASVGQSVRVVGFGWSTGDEPEAATRREGLAEIVELEGEELRLAPAPALPCVGDSGGPVFLEVEQAERLVGLALSGDPDCSKYASALRTDQLVDEFIDPYLAATSAGSADLGERCYDDDNCATGSCIEPLEAGFPYCSEDCTEDYDCAANMTCDGTAGVCRVQAPGPGAIGASCADGTQCKSGLCTRPRKDAALVCSVRCFQEATNCPEEFVCASDAENVSRLACFVEIAAVEGCSCGVGRHAQANRSTWLLLIVVFVIMSRPRRYGG